MLFWLWSWWLKIRQNLVVSPVGINCLDVFVVFCCCSGRHQSYSDHKFMFADKFWLLVQRQISSHHRHSRLPAFIRFFFACARSQCCRRLADAFGLICSRLLATSVDCRVFNSNSIIGKPPERCSHFRIWAEFAEDCPWERAASNRQRLWFVRAIICRYLNVFIWFIDWFPSDTFISRWTAGCLPSRECYKDTDNYRPLGRA